MSNVRYIEIDSTYRDRTKFPYPGEFEVPLAQSGTKGKLDALDPVSDSAPLFSWKSNEFVVGGGVTLTTIIDAVSPLSSTTSPRTLIITAPAGSMQQITNYYRSAIADNTTILSKRRIIRYEYLGSVGGFDRGIIEILTPYPDSFSLGDTITISDPTDITDLAFPYIFIPTGVFGDNAYYNDLLYNETQTTNNYKYIIDYDDITRLAQISGDLPLITGWTSTDVYSIRKIPPLEFGSITGLSTSTATLLWPSSSSIDNFYSGDFLRITRSSAVLTLPENDARRIVSYDGITKVITVFPPFNTLIPAVSTAEIIPFSRDNLTPLDYNGSTVSQQQMVCYEIGLLNLVVPNSIIMAGDRGSHIAFYPYLYVELSNATSASSGLNGVIYSNNPNSKKMLFRASVNNVNNPTTTSFVNITGNSMIQTIKFKPNDNLKFRVTLPGGETFNTTQQERFSPFLPNPLGQLSAAFSIKRL
jgi:hypothetical protein